MSVALIDLFYANEEWAKLRRPGAVEFVQKRLSALSKSPGDKPYLDGARFTAGDAILALLEQKPGALDQAAPLAGWQLPEVFAWPSPC